MTSPRTFPSNSESAGQARSTAGPWTRSVPGRRGTHPYSGRDPAAYPDLPADTATGDIVGVAGRVIFIRNSGKLCFATLQDGDGTQLQAMISLAKVGQDALDAWKADVDIGDIVYVHGEVISSRRGELSVLADTWQMASKSLRPCLSRTRR
ncbi:OB-fold nucleic acid binding domain protein [Mycobacterium xenopi 4042]|uniref:OB-fold nucleic acid binding domain protein n=1 Tax=Mycobacterium xenopi 4042 TaxID=1299334 RepID=X7ZWZ8_MYCXE|nr:OB-fold nucleic acid binding domain protein [Mycobacterium xenopi 4042]